MPADPSSSIPSALTQLAHADPLGPAEAPGLLTYLATIGDPRARKGRRHPLVAILATRRRVLGDDHPKTLASINSLAEIHRELEGL